MTLLLANARLIDPEALTETPGWLLIGEDGRIKGRGDGPAPAIEGAAARDCAGLALAPGIVDMRVFVGEPGERHKESYRTAGLAAAAGGVTTIAPQPDTEPPLDEPELLEFVHRRARAVTKLRVAPMAALTKGRNGREMAEYQFLLDAGASALTDGDRAIADPAVMRRCLSYARSVGALVCHHAQDPHLSAGGCATESLFASIKGLPTIPAEAEAMALERDLRLVGMTRARYHMSQISTRAALEPLRRAKEAGLQVSAAVSAAHFALNEFDIGDFRTFAKVAPPLRIEDDRAAMEEALAEGLIDVITSSHRPQDEDSKRLPFAQAAAGTVGLETLLAVSLGMVHRGLISLPTLFARLSLAPARLLGVEGGRLAVGAPADLVLFDENAPWIIDRKALLSRSKNSAFHERRVQGRVKATWIGGEQVFG